MDGIRVALFLSLFAGSIVPSRIWTVSSNIDAFSDANPNDGLEKLLDFLLRISGSVSGPRVGLFD